jgi:hypothetical protein
MSLNRACPDAPLPVLADSAAVLGTAWIGAGAVLAQGTIVRSHQEAVSIGNHSAVLRRGCAGDVECRPSPALGVKDLEVPVATAARHPKPRVAHGRLT